MRNKTLGGPGTRNSGGPTNQWVHFGWGPWTLPTRLLRPWTIAPPINRRASVYCYVLETVMVHTVTITFQG